MPYPIQSGKLRHDDAPICLCSCVACALLAHTRTRTRHNISAGSWRKPNPHRIRVIFPLCSSRSLMKIAPITYLFAHFTTMAHPSKCRTAAIAGEQGLWDGDGAHRRKADMMDNCEICAVPVPVSYFLRNVGGHWSSPDASTIGDGNRRASRGGSFACE